MGSAAKSPDVVATLVLLMLSSFTIPSESRQMGFGIYDSVKHNLPDLSSVGNIYDSVQEKTQHLTSDTVNDLYQTYGVYAVDAVRDTAKYYLHDEQARSDLTHYAESLVLVVLLELAKTVPGGVPAYKIVSKLLQSDQNLQGGQDQSQLSRFIAEFAKNAGSFAVEKGTESIPGGEPVYKILSQSLRSLQYDKEFADHRREIRELRARIDRLEKERCGRIGSHEKLHDQTETPKMDLSFKSEYTRNQD